MRHALITSLLLLSVPALAQDGVHTAEPEIVYQPVTKVDFETPLDVDGTLLTPAVKLVSTARRANVHPLIRLRTDFAAEMSRSVDLVK